LETPADRQLGKLGCAAEEKGRQDAEQARASAVAAAEERERNGRKRWQNKSVGRPKMNVLGRES